MIILLLYSKEYFIIYFRYVVCIKDIKEWNNRQKDANVRYIILSSFESLDLGVGYVS